MLPNRLARLMTWGLLLVSLSLFVASVDVTAAQLGDVTITLEDYKYRQNKDRTKFVYRVSSSTRPNDQAWILELGDCILPEFVNEALTSPFTWTEEPFRGLRFVRTRKDQKFVVWLSGQWDKGVASMALITGTAGNEEILIGEIDGPYCVGSSIALEITAGAGISFPPISGPGLFLADQETTLRVTSSSSGWTLSHSLDLTIPTGAWAETVERMFLLTMSPFAALEGTADIQVAYTLNPNEEDFGGLPQGDYVIGITFVVSTD